MEMTPTPSPSGKETLPDDAGRRRLPGILSALGGAVLAIVLLPWSRTPHSAGQASSSIAANASSATADASTARHPLRTRIPSTRELRRLLEECDEVPMSPGDRKTLQTRLLNEWAAKDPKAAYLWLRARPLSYCTLEMPPIIAQRMPEMVFQFCTEDGDRLNMMRLCRDNPHASLNLLISTGLLDDQLAVYLCAGDGELTLQDFQQIGKIEDPELRDSTFRSATRSLAESGDFSRIVSLWKEVPGAANAGNLAIAVLWMKPSDSVLETLLPGDTQVRNDRDPLSRLQLLAHLQAAYLPEANDRDWKLLLNGASIVNAGEHLDAIVSLAKGERTPENLATLCQTYLEGSGPVFEPDVPLSSPDPEFRDLYLRTLLESERGERIPPAIIRQQYISRITDDSLRAQMMAKYFPSPASDPAPPEK